MKQKDREKASLDCEGNHTQDGEWILDAAIKIDSTREHSSLLIPNIRWILYCFSIVFLSWMLTNLSETNASIGRLCLSMSLAVTACTRTLFPLCVGPQGNSGQQTRSPWSSGRMRGWAIVMSVNWIAIVVLLSVALEHYNYIALSPANVVFGASLGLFVPPLCVDAQFPVSLVHENRWQ